MPDADSLPAQALKRNARLGMVALAARSLLENSVILVANIYLARWLNPSDFGIFGILQFALSFFRLLSDAGLATALIQQQDAPNDTELSTIWWLQLLIGAGLTAASFLIAPLLPVLWQSMPREAAWLLPGLALGLLFTMLQSIPFLILERQVRFGWVSTFEFIGTIMFYGTAMFLAARHAGASALVWASVAQAAVVSILANLLQPWKPKLRFAPSSIRRLLKFGAAFQGGNAIDFVNAAVTPMLVGARLGSGPLGLIQFAERSAFFPSMFVSIVRRAYFPLLCRLQSDKRAFKQELEQAVVLSALPSFFFFGLFAGVAPVLISMIYGAKWLPAVPALYVYSLGFSFTFFSWIGDAAMGALGDMGRLFRIKVIAALINWTATMLAISWFPSPLAFAFGYLTHLVLTPMMIYMAIRRFVPELRIFSRIRGPAAASIALFAAGRLSLPHIESVYQLIGYLVAGLGLYCSVALAVDRELRRITGALILSRWPAVSRSRTQA